MPAEVGGPDVAAGAESATEDDVLQQGDAAGAAERRQGGPHEFLLEQGTKRPIAEVADLADHEIDLIGQRLLRRISLGHDHLPASARMAVWRPRSATCRNVCALTTAKSRERPNVMMRLMGMSKLSKRALRATIIRPVTMNGE